MVVIKPRPGESQEKMILRFRKKVQSSGLINEIKERDRYRTKSELRKLRKYQVRHLRELEKIREAA